MEYIRGAGFNICASDESLFEFIKKHLQTLAALKDGRRIIDYYEACIDGSKTWNPKEDLFDYSAEIDGTDSGFYGVVADIIYHETGVGLMYITNYEDGDEYLMLAQMRPWNFNEAEKKLTADSFEKLCQKYIDELNPNLVYDDDIAVEVQ